MILILTSKQDVHVDEVVRKLDRRGSSVFRLNSEDILKRYRFQLGIGPGGEWFGTCTDQLGRTLDLRTVRVAWYRKPSFDFDYELNLDEESRRFAGAEIRSFFETLYTLPGIVWINPPHASDRAKTKFQQLLMAVDGGVRVPRTLITTSPDAAKEFFHSCGDVALVKAIYTANATIDGRNRGVPSIKIGPEEFYGLIDQVRLAPVQFQEYVEKAFELRITIIGDAVIAVRIDSQTHEETKVDWRLHSALNSYSVFELPQGITFFCRELLRLQGLMYGAMDFIVTPQHEYFFLENNPFGQYLWLEIETGAPLTDTMCDLLQRYE